MNEFLSQILFSLGQKSFTNGQVLGGVILILLAFLAFEVIGKRLIRKYFAKAEIDARERRKTFWNLHILFYLVAALALVWSLDLRFVLFSRSGIEVTTHTLFQALIILQIARFIDWIISRFIIHAYYARRDNPREETSKTRFGREETGSRTVQYAVYVFAIILFLRSFQIDALIFQIPPGSASPDFVFRISSIFIIIFIFLTARLLIWMITQILLYSYIKKRELNVGVQYTITQLVRYVVYVIAIVMAIEYLGINTTLIWGGAAALLVGIGLGLQKTFNDFFSGLILMFERGIEVGHVVEINGLIGMVKRMGLRSSLIETIDHVIVIVPNGEFISSNVINWSHTDEKVRFKLEVGVAYGSDTELVKEVLLQMAKEHKAVLRRPAPLVVFSDFGASGLIFKLHFWSGEFLRHDVIKSELRFMIEKRFREEKITIPFPQRDVWIHERK